MLQALSMNEALVKTILLRTDRIKPVGQTAPNIALSPHDARILAGLALGYDMRETAKRLMISYPTIKDYLHHRISPLFGAHTQGETIYRAFQGGLFVVGRHPSGLVSHT
ncbi:MAG TPA: hypothetical protein VGO07_03095 [Candidatus Saccharimonadales bacterium]|jgi:DNA-binding NarL/FixJ family response regulator|nr:hypothetical protein [Candidatus Saccharimonadales bacterium]